MNENPKVSIIIPVYNVEQYLRQCLDSVINQTYKNLEIICVDDGSTDNSGKICEEYTLKDNRIKVIHKENGGISSARNVGLGVLVGKYVSFVDADDYLENNFIEKLVEVRADITLCSFYKEYPFNSEKNIITNAKISKTKDEFICDILSFQKATGCAWARLFNAKFLKENNLLYDESLKVAEDADFSLRTAHYNSQIVYIPEVLYHYNFSSGSIVRKFNKSYFECYKKSLNKMEHIIDKTKYLIQWNNFVAHHLLLICVNYCFNLSNKNSYNKKKQMLKEVLKEEMFENSVKVSCLRDFPLSKRITLFCLKHNIYFVVYIISIIRNKIR